MTPKKRHGRLRFAVAPLAFRGFLSAQFRLDKHINSAIHHVLNIARFYSGAVILHHQAISPFSPYWRSISARFLSSSS